MREVAVPALTTAPRLGGLADAVFDNAEERPGLVALRRSVGGQWQDVTAARFRDEVVALAKGLLSQGIRFGDRVAIMSRNRYEWTLFDFALWTLGAESVPIYPTSSSERVRWMLADSDCVACVVEDESHAMTVGAVINTLPAMTAIWQLDADAVGTLTARGTGIDDEVVHRHRLAVTPEAVATVVYTSGTTGRPRGCVLTHGNFMAECDNLLARWEPVFGSRTDEPVSTLLFLPLANVFGRVVEVAAVRGRVCVGHQPGMALASLLPVLAEFRPTFVLAVPYVFEKVFSAARHQAETAGRLGAFDKAVDVAVRYAEAREAKAFGEGPGPSASLRMQHQFYDRLVYGRLRETLGGRVRYGMSGGSAMDRRLGLFFAGAGLTVCEGYGMTETTAAVTANPPDRVRFGTVGPPVPGTSVRIAEDGEVWVRGGQLSGGYLNESGAGLALRDGWLATGDLGTLDDAGYLTITGRKKDVIVTSKGKSVSPVLVEERVRAHPLVAQCVVVGNDRPHVAALLTLDHEAVRHWLATRGRPVLPPEEMVRDEELEAELRRAVGAANALASQAESIRTYVVLPSPFTEEEGLLTPSLKPRRDAIEEAFAGEIEEMYRP